MIDPRYVPMMNTMMQETLLTGTAHKAELPGWQAAGKTGTSQDFRDAWFVGYTSALVTAVWLGNDDDSPTKKVSGGNLPVEVWSRFMKAALQSVPPAPLPLGTWQPQPANPFAPLLAPFMGNGQPAQGSPIAPPTPPGLIPSAGGRGGGQPVAAAPSAPAAAPAPQPAPAAPPASAAVAPAALAPQPPARPRAPAQADAPVPPSPIPGAAPGPEDQRLLRPDFGAL